MGIISQIFMLSKDNALWPIKKESLLVVCFQIENAFKYFRYSFWKVENVFGKYEYPEPNNHIENWVVKVYLI